MTNFSSEYNLPTFQLNAPVIMVKVKEVWTNIAIYSHALPRRIQSKRWQVIFRTKVGNR